MRELSVAVVGLGNVGRAFVRLARAPARERAIDPGAAPGGAFAVTVRAVADSSGMLTLASESELTAALAQKETGGRLADLAPDRIVTQPAERARALASAGVDLVVESLASSLTDGQPGLDVIEAALAAGIHVVTVDKGPLVRGCERLEAARRGTAARLRGSGTTGVVAPPELGVERVLEIRGVLNGATNYILTEMVSRSLRFEAALDEARRLGLTEPDPRQDLEGWDTAVKLTLLARAVMGSDVQLDDVARLGLGPETEPLVANARATGRRVRLVGRARIWQGRFRLSVAPKIVGPESPFFPLEGTVKAATFRTESGERVAHGTSGPEATARVIAGDIAAIYFSERQFEGTITR